MASAYIYTPCKNKKYETCNNYRMKCGICTHRWDYTVLLAKEHKDYYEKNK